MTEQQQPTLPMENKPQEATKPTAPFSQPALPPLYFAQQNNAAPLRAGYVELPHELLHKCLVQYCEWGDLAKVANVQKGWKNIMRDAASQDAESKWQLAQALLQGECGLQQNHPLALELLLELSKVETDAGHIPLGLAEETPEEETANETESEETATITMPDEAVEEFDGYAPALKAIAKCYLEGQGVTQNTDIGVAWLRAAYQLAQDVEAAHELALVYEFGRHGVELDIFAAAEWLKRAAKRGHIEAMAELGLCYELGCGVEQNDTNALDWYMQAANAGHLTAKYSVGEAFEEARGVPQSDEEACLWYYKAAVEGDYDSKMALRRLEEIARIVVPGARALLDA